MTYTTLDASQHNQHMDSPSNTDREPTHQVPALPPQHQPAAKSVVHAVQPVGQPVPVALVSPTKADMLGHSPNKQAAVQQDGAAKHSVSQTSQHNFQVFPAEF